MNHRNNDRTRGAIAAAMIAAGAMLACSHAGTAYAAPAAETPAAFVRVETVTADSTVRESIVQNMSIEAVARVQMTPRVTGRLERLHVRPGDFVKAGDVVATLEHDQQDALIGSTKAQVASARADSERARAEMANAKTNLDRYERLVKEGFSTQQQYDAIRTTYVSAKASYNAAVAREEQARAELGRVESTRADYIMKSPLDGTVLTDFSLTPGAMISPSSPIVDIADMRRMKASMRIPELKIFTVEAGMDVYLRFDALPGEEFRGAVSRVDSYVDPSTRTSAVEIELDNEAIGNRLRPGMFGTASIVEREHKNAVVITDTAVLPSDSGSIVFVEEDGVARMRHVTVGTQSNGTAHITSGLSAGERVIVFGGSSLNDGDRVSVQ